MLKMLLLESAVFDSTDLITGPMGMGIVFVGLIALIFICKIMGAVFGKTKVETNSPNVPAVSAPVKEETLVIPNKSEFVAAVSAAIAESMGTDISKIRIHSIKKVN